LQNIILAQTFGVAAAETFDLTIFDIIHSYLNVSDDLIGGDSLFKAEVKRAQGILEKIKSLEPGKKYFFALDELFTGTGAEAGEQCAYAFIDRIADFDNILFIYATHFEKLKELANNNDHCANYKVEAPTRDENGKLVYPFKLSEGVNTVNVALDIAKEAGLFA
jgi:DNA mismatch repair ATPase MutS